jgi:hypothetical protein
LAGDYSVKGTNPGGGSNYDGALRITKRGSVLQFSWKSGANAFDGVGVQVESSVGVAFANGKDGKGCSVVHYRLESNGSLQGRWGAWDVDSSGTEKAVRSGVGAGLSGQYDVSGSRLDGKAYKGTLNVGSEGAGFLFNWNTGDLWEGFGVQTGNSISVGIGGAGCGFVSYQVRLMAP